jgi:predicted RNA-binding protein with TRAM domain
VVTVALLVASLVAVTDPAGAQPGAQTLAAAAPTGVGALCAAPLFAAPVPVGTARERTPVKFRVAQSRSQDVAGELDPAAVDEDATAWFDRCGRLFYVDELEAHTDGHADGHADLREPTARAAPRTAAAALSASEALALHSLPGSSRTIYLDFTGGVVDGTAWNDSFGPAIVAEPYSRDSQVDTAFSAAEIADIHDAWQVVAADYAAFDVDVTTQWPGQEALTRTGGADTTYGSHVRISSEGRIYDDCRCSGVAYVGTFDTTYDHDAYQVAWVFADGAGGEGHGIGQVVSHEVGHQLGLDHDGSATESYATGGSPWAPIMGSSYYEPVSQWSRGEYAGADNLQDDVAVMSSSGAPLRTDDHPDGPAATPLVSGVPRRGVVSTREDRDVFSLAVRGATTVAVTADRFTNLDVELQVRDGAGGLVATVDPLVVRQSYAEASGLDAAWSATLATGGTYTFTVDGVGNRGSGLRYSDYASLGGYTITATTEPSLDLPDIDVPDIDLPDIDLPDIDLPDIDLPPIDLPPLPPVDVPDVGTLLGFTTAKRLPSAVPGAWYREAIAVRGSQGRVSWQILRGGPPAGLRLVAVGDRAVLVGRARRPQLRRIVLRATDAAGTSARRTFVVRVVRRR